MSTYADAAASSGPIGAEKLPEPAQVEKTTNPKGSVETIDGKEFEKKKKEAAKEAKKVTEEATKKAKKQAEIVKGEIDDFKKDTAPYLEKAINYVKDTYAQVSSAVSSRVNSQTASQAVTELQNPVVISQLALIAGGATAGWFVYSERAHIRSDNKIVVAIHAGIATALILGDVYLFQNLYPKYKKN